MTQPRNRKILYTLLTIILVLVVAVGIMRWALNRNTPKFYGNYETNMFAEDSLLGYITQPCEYINSMKVQGGDTIYSVDYLIRCNGLRNTGQAYPSDTKHLLFFGCSFTFGEGLPDSSTIAFRMNGDGFHTYNLGLPGYGPQQMLSRLESDSLNTVKEDSGIAIYTLLPDHIYRAIGAPYVLAYWGDKMPYYTNDNGLQRHASFQKEQPLKTLWYKLLGFCGLMNVKSIARPEIIPKDIALVTAIIKRSEEVYLYKYPGSKFYVLCHPSPDIPEAYERLVWSLKKEGLNVLDYRQLFAMDDAHTIAGDGHPNAMANGLVVKKLKEDLQPVKVPLPMGEVR